MCGNSKFVENFSLSLVVGKTKRQILICICACGNGEREARGRNFIPYPKLVFNDEDLLVSVDYLDV